MRVELDNFDQMNVLKYIVVFIVVALFINACTPPVDKYKPVKVRQMHMRDGKMYRWVSPLKFWKKQNYKTAEGLPARRYDIPPKKLDVKRNKESVPHRTVNKDNSKKATLYTFFLPKEVEDTSFSWEEHDTEYYGDDFLELELGNVDTATYASAKTNEELKKKPWVTVVNHKTKPAKEYKVKKQQSTSNKDAEDWLNEDGDEDENDEFEEIQEPLNDSEEDEEIEEDAELDDLLTEEDEE